MKKILFSTLLIALYGTISFALPAKGGKTDIEQLKARVASVRDQRGIDRNARAEAMEVVAKDMLKNRKDVSSSDIAQVLLLSSKETMNEIIDIYSKTDAKSIEKQNVIASHSIGVKTEGEADALLSLANLKDLPSKASIQGFEKLVQDRVVGESLRLDAAITEGLQKFGRDMDLSKRKPTLEEFIAFCKKLLGRA